VHGRVDLGRRTKESEAADIDPTNVQNDTVEVEKHPLAKFNVRAIVAKEAD
jgi:hypothetical protein